MDRNTMVEVTNRSNGFVSYSLPEIHVSRTFSPYEMKKVKYSELEDLSMQPGGLELIKECLLVKQPEAIKQIINGEPEPEYWLDEKTIPKWMNESSLDEFKDGLDFAPEGVKDLIKKIAVEMPLNDNAKREAILDILKFNVTSAIAINKESKAAEGQSIDSSPSHRRTASTITKPKYEVISSK